MTEHEHTWDEVGERFAALGRLLKDRFEQEREDDDQQAVRDAFSKLAEAARRLGDAVGEAVRDPAVREQAREVGRSLNDAVVSTVRDLDAQLRNRPARPTGPETTTADAGPDVADEDGPTSG
jgi:hypothetical protein